jgi:hypothetical protein
LTATRATTKRTAAAFWPAGESVTKNGRYFVAKASDSVAMVPESMTSSRAQPNRKPTSGP